MTHDIYKIEQDGSVLWKGAAESFEVAQLSVAVLAETNPANYLIVDSKTGSRTVIKADGSVIIQA